METSVLSPRIECSPWDHQKEGNIHMHEARRVLDMWMHDILSSPLV
jgi:hypothetical protein